MGSFRIALLLTLASTQLVQARVPSSLLFTNSTTTPAGNNNDVPQWFEDCVLHWAYIPGRFYGDVLVDRKPFTHFCGFSSDTCVYEEQVNRCWYSDAQCMAYPRNGDFSPLMLRALKNLVAKGHLRPFSIFEVRERKDEIGLAAKPPLDNWMTARLIHWHFVAFRAGLEKNCTDSIAPCDDYSCDQHSLEYWCHFFRVLDAPLRPLQMYLSRPLQMYLSRPTSDVI